MQLSGLLLKKVKKLVAFEVKFSKRPVLNDIENLLAFIEENPQINQAGGLLHAGRSIKWLHSKVLAVPWWWIVG